MVASEIIERKATNEINRIIDLDHRLSSYVNVGDKEPVLDGFIDVYKDEKSRSVTNLEFRIPIQVKGQTNSMSSKGATYSIKREWLKFYAENNGALFFVVFLNREATTVIGVYYASFTPAEANLLMKRMGTQKSKSVRLNRLSDDQLHRVLKKFHVETDTFNKNVKVVDAATVSGLSNPTIALPVGADPRDLDPEQIVFTGIQDGIRVLVDLAGVQNIEFSPTEKTTVTFPNGVTYEGLMVSNQENSVLHVNQNIKILFEPQDDRVGIKMNWNFHSRDIDPDEATKMRRNDMEMLASLIDGEGIHVKNSWVDSQVPIPLNEEAKASLQELKDEALMIRNLAELKSIMNTDFTNMKLDQESMRQLRLTISLLNPTPEQIDNVDPLLRIVIDGKKYYLTFFNGLLKSMFSEDSDIQFGKVGLSDEPDGDIFEAGNPLLMIGDNDYVNMPQYDVNVVLRNNVVPIDDMTPKWYANKYENTMLGYIDTFDLTGDTVWLQAASGFVDMIAYKNQYDVYRTALNAAQIQLRKGDSIELETVKTMYDILTNSDDSYLKTGAAILLRDENRFVESIEPLDRLQRKALIDFPIGRMMTDSMKNILSNFKD